MFHTRKMRTKSEFYSPGGGGINVARVFVRLGGNARSYYMAGGATGDALDGLLDLHQLVPNRIYIAGHTRVASAVLELESGRSEEHTSELQSLMRISYAVFCLKKKKNHTRYKNKSEHQLR